MLDESAGRSHFFARAGAGTGAMANDALTNLKPKTATQTPEPKAEPVRRIILLSGDWWMPGSVFHLEATIFAASGGAEGEIFWTNIDTPFLEPNASGTELVRGMSDGMSLELRGYRVDGPLVTDYYLIALIGEPKGGRFEGRSEAFGTWNGRLSGSYQVVEERG
jgi:hypothetical protein